MSFIRSPLQTWAYIGDKGMRKQDAVWRDAYHTHTPKRKKSCIWMRIMFSRKLRCLILQIHHQDVWIIHKALRTKFPKNEKSLNTGFSLLSSHHHRRLLFFSDSKQSRHFFLSLMHCNVLWKIRKLLLLNRSQRKKLNHAELILPGIRSW